MNTQNTISHWLPLYNPCQNFLISSNKLEFTEVHCRWKKLYSLHITDIYDLVIGILLTLTFWHFTCIHFAFPFVLNKCQISSLTDSSNLIACPQQTQLIRSEKGTWLIDYTCNVNCSNFFQSFTPPKIIPHKGNTNFKKKA